MGERGEGPSGLQQAYSNGHLFQITGAGLDSGGQKLAGGSREPPEGEDDLGTANKDTGTGGRLPTGLRDILQGCGTGGTTIWVRDAGDDSPHGQILGFFPAQSRHADYRETDEATCGWELGVPTARDKNRGGGV